MSDLRERFQELADAGARHGRTPGPQAALRRARQRRLRLVGVTAILLAGSGPPAPRATRAVVDGAGPVPGLPPPGRRRGGRLDGCAADPLQDR
jgi:hypothetical protein